MVKVRAGTRIITVNRKPSAAPATIWIITISSAIVFSRFPTGPPLYILIWASQSARLKPGGTTCLDCDHSRPTVGQQQVFYTATCLTGHYTNQKNVLLPK